MDKYKYILFYLKNLLCQLFLRKVSEEFKMLLKDEREGEILLCISNAKSKLSK